MNSNRRMYRFVLFVVVSVYIIEWFVNSVYLRILAGIFLMIAISMHPISMSKKKPEQGDDSPTLSEIGPKTGEDTVP